MLKISARNVLKGKVKKITPGAVNSEVIVELPGGSEIVSIITRESAESMKIAVGKEIAAVIKASSVMLAVDWKAAERFFSSLSGNSTLQKCNDPAADCCQVKGSHIDNSI